MLTRRNMLAGTASLPILSSLPGLAFSAGLPAWNFLQNGDVIDVIAPSSPVDDPIDRYKKIKDYFSKTPYRVHIPDDLIEPTLPLDEANTIKKRAAFIHQAFMSESKAVWAIGGGGWGTSMLDELKKYPKPTKVKPVLGYSDVTALHIFVNTVWGFPSIHSIVLGINSDISPGWNKDGLQVTLDVLGGKKRELCYYFKPLNDAAMDIGYVETKIVGGNSLLVSALNGTTDYTLDTKGKFLFLESVADGPGQFSRKLTGLSYSPIIRDCEGIIFGDIIQAGGEPNPADIEAQFDFILARFANRFAPDKIVMRSYNLFGHGPSNPPLPLNTWSHFSRRNQSILGCISANMI